MWQNVTHIQKARKNSVWSVVRRTLSLLDTQGKMQRKVMKNGEKARNLTNRHFCAILYAHKIFMRANKMIWKQVLPSAASEGGGTARAVTVEVSECL